MNFSKRDKYLMVSDQRKREKKVETETERDGPRGVFFRGAIAPT